MERPAVAAPAFVRCAAATSVDQACSAMADDLVDLGFELPSVYLLTGQRLRCRAARGYFQVVDGFRPGTGIIGKVVESARSELIPDVRLRSDFIGAVPGLVAEACAPVLVAGEVVGALSVESTTTLPDDTLEVLEQASSALGATLTRLGGLPPLSLAQRLAHVSVELTTARRAEDIRLRAARAACDLSGMDGAALLAMERPGRPDTLHITCTVGPVAEALREWDASQFVVLASWVDADTSSHYPGGQITPPGYEFLRAARIGALSVHPLVVANTVTGYLVLVSDRPLPRSAEVGDCMDLLAAQTAAVLSAAAVVEELSDRAERDELTGLGNRSALTGALDKALARAAAGDAAGSVGVLLIDLDDFKHVNDNLGHHVGDRLLVEVAGVLRRSVRQSDVACRLGGDEFAIVLPETDASTAGEVAERILRTLAALPPVEQTAAAPNASIGVVLADGTSEGPAELLRAADVAMYLAKERGKGQWALYEPDQQQARTG